MKRLEKQPEKYMKSLPSKTLRQIHNNLPYFDRFNFFVKAIIILFFHFIQYQIMNQKSSSSSDQPEQTGRFLMRHSSSSVLSIFGCCTSVPSSDLQSEQRQKTPPQKISIKNVMRKSGIYGCNGNSSISGSRFQQGAKKSLVGNSSQKFLNRKISQYSQISNQTVKNQSERNNTNKISLNNHYIQQKNRQDNSVHNYHTTNYLVEKYIVQAEQTNIFLRQQKEKKIRSAQILPNKDLGYGFKQIIEQSNDNSPKWGQQINQFPSPRFSANKQDNSTLNCHFSFGQHQKAMFMNKFGGFRQVISNRPSYQSVSIQNQQDANNLNFIDNQSKPYNFSKNKQQKLHNLVRNIQSLNEDSNDFSSDNNSQVIDSYQNIMSRIQDRSKVMFLTRNQEL